MRRKHGLLLFIASCIPGCGEMYQGYMKRGISILTVFYGLLTIAIFLEVGALAVLLPPIQCCTVPRHPESPAAIQ